MPMSAYEKSGSCRKLSARRKNAEGERQYERFRSEAMIRLDKAMKYAQIQKNDPCSLGRYADQRYWDGYLAALDEVRHLL